MATETQRTARQVFRHHAEVVRAGDLDGIVADYAEDADALGACHLEFDQAHHRSTGDA